jgi:hypothetical protein
MNIQSIIYEFLGFLGGTLGGGEVGAPYGGG